MSTVADCSSRRRSTLDPRAVQAAPWRGSLTLTAAERASLRVDRVVTGGLIDDLLPTVEYIAFFGPMKIDAETRHVWEVEARQQADAARDTPGARALHVAARAPTAGYGADD